MHARSCGTSELIGTHFTTAKGNKRSSNVEFNVVTTDDSVTIRRGVKRNDETNFYFIKKGTYIESENGAQIGRFLLRLV